MGKKIHAIAMAALLSIVLACSAISFNRTLAWKDDYILLKDTTGKSPNKARPRSNLALRAYLNGLYDEAFFEAKKTIGLYYYYPTAHYIIGLTLYDKGRYAESLKAYDWALITAEKYLNNPAYMAQIHKSRGLAWKALGDNDSAAKEFNEATRLDPSIRINGY
ncbi:MAG: hypothetical protein WA162_07155 [Thermodesulfobacteriota bacterium]